MPPELLGPTGLLIALGIAVTALWRDHIRADADDRRERDDWQALALAGQADLRRLTEAVEAVLRDKRHGG